MNLKHRLSILALGLCAIIAGHSVYKITKLHTTPELPKVKPIKNDYQLIGQKMPQFQLPDLQGRARAISEWQGKTLLINFWATWCAPCRKEIPDLIGAQTTFKDKNVQIIGIAIDRPEMAYEFAQRYKINYPILYGEQDAMVLNERFGNKIGALPYTVVIDHKGIIRAIHDRGILTKQIIESMLQKSEPALNTNN